MIINNSIKNFATLLNCIDGRVQLPALNWIKANYDVAYVDIISEPGMDKAISISNKDFMNSLDKKICISLDSHNSKIIFIAGHYDCAANKVSKNTHIKHIKSSVDTIKTIYKNVSVIGLWINENFEVEKI